MLEILTELVIKHFAVFITVGGVGLTAFGGIVVAIINNRSTTVSKLLTEIRSENAEKQKEIDKIKDDKKEEYKELKAEYRSLQVDFRKLMRRLHITQNHVDELKRHINDGKGPPAPPYPKGYYGLDYENDEE